MDTKKVAALPEPRRRRRHSSEFKSSVIAACLQPGVSIAAIALANGLNANMLRTWVASAKAESALVTSPEPAPFFPLPIAPPPQGDIEIEVQRGATRVKLRWPASAAAECAAWLREWMR